MCGLTPSPSGFCDDQITTLTKDAEKLAISDPKRTALYRQIQQIAVNEKVMVIPINERKSTGLGQSYVHGDLPDPVYLLPAPETVWMEAA